VESTNRKIDLKEASHRFAVLAALLIFSLPLGQMAITNLIMFLLFIQSILSYRWSDWKLGFKDPLVWFSAGFYLYLLLSLMWSENHDSGWRQLETKTAFLLGPLIILAGKNQWSKRSRVLALKAFWWASILAIFLALIYAAYRSIQARAFYEESPFGRRYFFAYTHLATPLMHPGYLATYLGMAIFSTVELHQAESRKNWLWFYRASIILFLIFMLLLQARINLLAFMAVIGLGAFYIAWKRKAYLWLGLPFIPILALGLFMAFASPGMRDRYVQLPNFDYDISGDDFNSATYRLAEWKCASAVIADNFCWGTGIGDNHQALFDSYREFKFWEGLEKEYNAHNQFLETAISIGIPGMCLLLAGLLYFLYRAQRQKDYLALSCVVFLIICLLTESMFERMWGVLIPTIFIPFLLQQSKGSD